VPRDEFSRVALAADASRRDVLVVFDYRRYDEATTMLARQVASAGAQVVLLTDPWLSPVAEVADVVLPVRVESLSPFDSLVPALALVEALVAALTERRGEAGRTRVERFEAVGTLLDPGWPPTDRTARPLDDS
jgi:DNA-binding MurR/RpiR family transcriptional regulator